MNRSKYALIMIVVLMLAASVAGCSSAAAKGSDAELLIYCGVTMARPMQEIADIIEEQEGCTITLKTGGSGSLLETIRTEKKGDMYLPGSDSYIKTCLEEDLVSETVHVGYNKAAIMVQEGNPKDIPADLSSFVNPDYAVIVGDKTTGSIGKETNKILEKKRIWDQVLANADVAETSAPLMTAIKDGSADLTINWYAVSTWEENEQYVDALPINGEFASKKKLVIGLLNSSENPEVAQKFMEYAGSSQGQAIFDKYGLYNVE